MKAILGRLLFASLISVFAVERQSSAEVVRWAESSTPVSTQAGIAGAPDGINSVSANFTITSFQIARSYSGLSSLLGVSESIVARADVIAFELNGGSPAPSGGWESSRWTFTDGAHSVTADFNETAGVVLPPEIVANGSVAAEAYNLFFGVQFPGSDRVMSFLLFDISDVLDLDSPSFTISLKAGRDVGLPGEGTPDPDAIGLMRRVPEPGTAALVFAGIWFCGRGRRTGVNAPNRPSSTSRTKREEVANAPNG